jgi:penicillin-binding protein-related factor A (putative recombinase)
MKEIDTPKHAGNRMVCYTISSSYIRENENISSFIIINIAAQNWAYIVALSSFFAPAKTQEESAKSPKTSYIRENRKFSSFIIINIVPPQDMLHTR